MHELIEMLCQELARQLQQDIIPELDQCDVKLFLASIGTPERGIDFANLTGFPQDRLLADPENVLYTSLEMKTGLSTFFSTRGSEVISAKVRDEGKDKMRASLKRYKPYLPPKLGQVLQQGGCLIFNGKSCVYEWYDATPGDHVDFDVVFKNACPDLARSAT